MVPDSKVSPEIKQKIREALGRHINAARPRTSVRGLQLVEKIFDKLKSVFQNTEMF